MLDRYRFSQPSRLADESKFPIALNPREVMRPGGAANVAVGLTKLGYRVLYLGVTGNDPESFVLANALEAAGVDAALFKSADMTTMVKESVYVGNRCIVRLDKGEHGVPNVADAFRTMLNSLWGDWERASNPVSAVVLVDHDKLFWPQIRWATMDTFARFPGTPVFSDLGPKAAASLYSLPAYPLPGTFKCNRKALGGLDPGLEVFPGGTSELDLVCGEIRAFRARTPSLQAAEIVVTMAGGGSVHHAVDGTFTHMPVKPVEAGDIVGAGDAFTAAYVDAVVRRYSVDWRLSRANAAGRLCFQHLGVYTPSSDEIDAEVVAARGPQAKDRSLVEAADLAAAWRAQGVPVAVTNGCFDLLHPGHTATIAWAKAAVPGGRLIVLVNDDASVRALKGETRPICGIGFRSAMVSLLDSVDVVVTFDGDMEKVVRALLPDVLVKGAEYRERRVDGADYIASRGGSVLFAPMVPNFNTTAHLQRLQTG